MKRIWQTIKLKKYKTFIDELQLTNSSSNEFIICFDDGKWFRCISKEELRSHLEREHIRGIRFIFDMTDRITLERDILINIEEVEK